MYVFLHNMMKPVLAHKEIGEKSYRGLEEYLDLLIWTLDIAEEVRPDGGPMRRCLT
jgi:hypothetical protein